MSQPEAREPKAASDGGQILNVKKPAGAKRRHPVNPSAASLPSPRRMREVEARQMGGVVKPEKKSEEDQGPEVKKQSFFAPLGPREEGPDEEEEGSSWLSLLWWGGLIFLAGMAFWAMLSHIWEGSGEVLEEFIEEGSPSLLG